MSEANNHDQECENVINQLIEKIKNKSKFSEIIESKSDDEELKSKLLDFERAKSNLEESKKATKKDIEKWTGEFEREPNADLDTVMLSDTNAAKKKTHYRNMGLLAFGGIVFIGVLLSLAGLCASSNYCGTVEIKEKTEVDGKETMTTKNEPNNIPLKILESEFMLVLVATVIAPMVVRVLKEKYDIQIEESQITMIMNDAVAAVKMYTKDANRLRDKNGQLSEDSKKKLKNLAFNSISKSYTQEKYQNILANVGAQVFERAIESAATNGKLERLPLEKKQIEEIIKQSIDAIPQIVKWKDLDEEVKEKFIDGHIQRALSNVGIEGWAYKALENVFDAEVNQRLIAAAIVDKEKLLNDVQLDNKYLKYTTIVLNAATDSLSKRPKNHE